MPDAIFEEPRLARVYDPLDPDHRDLDVYAAVAEEFKARSLLDIGCGTGTFACLLAARGLRVTGLDLAAASLEVARSKPGAERVHWIHGFATDLPPMQVDLATMTGNVAQVFLTDDDWAATLCAGFELAEIRGAPDRPGREMVFIAVNPSGGDPSYP